MIGKKRALYVWLGHRKRGCSKTRVLVGAWEEEGKFCAKKKHGAECSEGEEKLSQFSLKKKTECLGKTDAEGGGGPSEDKR